MAGKAKDTSAKKQAASSDKVAPPAAPADSATADADQHGPVVPADVKSAFAAALERKKQAGQARSAHLDGHGGVGGATSSHKATRTFRRKSGSA